MKRTVVLSLLAIVTQAVAATPWWLVRPANLYVQDDDVSRRTPQQWQDILARQKTKPEDLPGFVRGSAPQPPEAGRTTKDFQSRIINGGAAARGQFPWQAYILLGSTNFCGGSLISSTWTLTAAHCVSGEPQLPQGLKQLQFASFTVTLGRTDLREAQEGAHSQLSRRWVAHSSYGSVFFENDIAIIRLPTPVTFTDFISPVRLPKYSQVSESFSGLDAIVTGFGRISSYNGTHSPTLQFAQVKIIPNAECVVTFPLNLRDSNICSLGDDGRSACNGDSGGPLVIMNDDVLIVVGVVSYGRTNCPAGTPSAYVRVTSYLRWIETYSGIAIDE